MPKISYDLTIDAPSEKVYKALSTQGGLRGWWEKNCVAEEREGGRAKFTFEGGKLSMTMGIDKLSPGKEVRWTCVDQLNNPEWQGTKVGFSLSGDGKKTRVAFVHDGFTEETKNFEMTVGGWKHFMDSLKSYVESGSGMPF
ncbi:MAG: SRPBCC domain-containing protein [Alphaproteobacteria bacterium]